jgi:excinuclease ABC subunit A
MPNPPREVILIRGARQNNLKNLTLELPTNELIVVTGVSGSGKSSLVFDTLYAEGQRRYVETFSPYARQFLDRMDKPQVDAIEGIPPAIAIDQVNPVRTSRSTVGTMTELNDHLKLLFARGAQLYCRGCGAPVRRDTPQTIFEELVRRAQAAGDPRLVIAFPVTVPKNFTSAEVKQLLAAQGYTRFLRERKSGFEVVQDRLRAGSAERARVFEALEAALRVGQGRVNVYAEEEIVWRFSSDFHCADCDIHYQDPTPSLFSFNSPLGACEACRGFGRVIGIDYGLIVPDESKTLRQGAVRPWQTPSYNECQDDLEQYAKKRAIPLDTPWRGLTEQERRWVLEGESEWVSWRKSWPGTWYGVSRFFQWLETKAYKMHIRVLLSKYRAYTPCAECGGARLKTEALLWRVGTQADADPILAPDQRFLPRAVQFGAETLAELPGLTLHDLVLLPIARCRAFIENLHLPAPLDDATELLLREIRTRLSYLSTVGLDYLTLDRQSRTLSGGEVQRINLTTALGTSLVNTLFVLDEPSIGLHPRDMGRVIDVMHRLRDAGNSLVVVEHDPHVMLAADRILDMGPGPGERGGEVVFFGTPDALKRERTLTADYLAGRRRADAGVAPMQPNPTGPVIELLGAAEHNLKGIDIVLPLQRLVCITGVSGSGKSTLVQDVLYAALLKAKGKPTENPGRHRALKGHEHISDMVLVDQSPIGRTARSNPASYVGAFDAIRSLFAKLPLAKQRGYTAGTFSFNAGNGRCPACSGSGFEHVEMQFLSDVYLRCPDCDGRRFRGEVLELVLRGRSIADVLELTVSEALAFFSGEPDIRRTLQPLADVGLEYLKLGQPVPTLSGGEAQRLKLAGHLAKATTPALRATPPSEGGDRGAADILPSLSRRGARGNAEGGVVDQGKLFLFDEPTTGLHFDDVTKLLRALRQLIAAGHSLVVIEHNLDLIRSADWIIDLGPEGGEAGGEIVCTGMPAEVMAHPRSHTGKALREYEQSIGIASPLKEEKNGGGPLPAALHLRGNSICIHNAREHNLKNIDVELPRGTFTVVTGVSGSGKSTLAFDILFAEGQRRYLESLNAYARQFVQSAARPDVDAIFGIPPTVAIEQRVSRGGRKSTVATLTEIYHFLRLLYVKLGRQYCPDCNVVIEPQSVEAIAARIVRDYRGSRIGLLAPLVVSRKGYYTDLAQWAAGRGYTHLRVDREFLPTAKWPRLSRFKEHSIELPVADLRVAPENEMVLRAGLATALEAGGGVVHVLGNLDSLAQAMKSGNPSLTNMTETVFSTKRACPSCSRSFPELDPRLFSFNSKHGWCADCYGTGLKLDEVGWEEERMKTGAEDHVLDSWLEWLEIDETCPSCHGKRLNREALAVRYRGLSIADLTALPVAEVEVFFRDMALQGREAEIARDMLAELRSRLRFLDEVGLSYLALDRSAPTLSGGEAQRIRLAAQLGSNLRGVCYILDEPTIGLHQRDNRILLETLQRLEAKGNTLVVVEHDEDTIRRAAHVIDLGPGAGKLGGRVIATGSAADLMRHPESLTGKFLAAPLRHPLHAPRNVDGKTLCVEIAGASLHNLKHFDVRIPLGRLVVVTGVSGSGKSTFARDVLHSNLVRLLAERRIAPRNRKANGARHSSDGKAARRAPDSSSVLHRSPLSFVGCREISGWENVGRVLEVDQAPIGKTPRSCPATYVGFWDRVRHLFAEVTEARIRGYTASRFSFNTKDGRCEACEGQGLKKIEMSFLPDVKVICEVCRGARFDSETLAVRFKDKSIGDVLAMNVDEAVEFFSAHPAIHHCLELLQEVGLGYLTLGQQSPTLSGGEAQRIKLVTELAKVRALHPGLLSATRDERTSKHPSPPGSDGGAGTGGENHTLYVLDEPTVGLHMADVEKLIHVLHRLVDVGNTVVVIEHNLDIIAEGDWIIDLGPEGGDAGGCIVAQGTPEDLVEPFPSVPRRGGSDAEGVVRSLPGRIGSETDGLVRSHTARVLAEFLAGRRRLA